MNNSKSIKKRYKENNPIRCAWHDLRSNAKRRNIPCTISFEDFREWCIAENYIELKGRCVGAMHVDRIVESLGYAKGNIQILRIDLNTIKEIYRQQGESASFDWYVDFDQWKPAEDFENEEPF